MTVLHLLLLAAPVCFGLAPAPDSPWPQKGQDPSHRGQGLNLDNANSIVVLNKTIAGAVFAPDSAPVIDVNGTAYFGSLDQNVYAVEPDGTLKWNRSLASGGIWATPILADNRTIFVGTWQGVVYGLKTGDGSVIFKYDTGGNILAMSMHTDGTVYLSCAFGSAGKLFKISDGVMKTLTIFENGPCSSPTISPDDGTVYIGCMDMKVYRVDGTTGEKKWDFTTHQPVKSTPVLSLDGQTVFFGSEDGHFYSVHTADGTLAWPTPEGAVAYSIDSSAVLSHDGSKIIFGSLDPGDGSTQYPHNASVYALDTTTGQMVWQWPPPNTQGVRSIRAAPTLSRGQDGADIVYVNCDDGNFYALNAEDGTLIRNVTIGKSSTTMALGADGSLVMGGADGSVLMLGLSASHVVSALRTARTEAMNNHTELVQAKLSTLCSFKSQLDSSTPYMLKEAVGLACSTYANAQNGADPFGTRYDQLLENNCIGCTQNYVANPTPYKQLKDVLQNDMIPLLRSFEDQERRIKLENITVDGQREIINAAVTSVKTDLDSWKKKVAANTQLLGAYGTQVATVQQMLRDLATQLSAEFNKTETAIGQNITDAKAGLKKAHDKWEAQKWLKILKAAVEAIAGVVSTFYGNPNGTAMIKQSVTDAVAAYHFVKDGCKPCQPWAELIAKLGRQLDDVHYLANATVIVAHLDSLIKTGDPTQLPEQLPNILMDQVQTEDLANYLSTLQDQMINQDGVDPDQIAEVKDIGSRAQDHIKAVMSWYQVAMKIQDQNGTVTALQTRLDLYNNVSTSEKFRAAALAQGLRFVEEQRWNQAALVMQYMKEEFQQYRFWSLDTTPSDKKGSNVFKPPPNPTSDDFLNQQTNLDTRVLDAQKQHFMVEWANFFVEEVALACLPILMLFLMLLVCIRQTNHKPLRA